MDMDRREMMKLAVLFAAATWLERGQAMDNPGAMPRAAAGKDDPQNAYAVGGTSNFKAVYGDGTQRAAFLLFLTNVYSLYPEDKFHKLIADVTAQQQNDRDIYKLAQSRLKEIRPFLADVRRSLPALSKQKTEMAQQTMALIGEQKKVNGYMEIGTTGRYISRIRKQVDLGGDLVLLHSDAPTNSAVDIAERGQLGKLGRFVPLDDYAAVAPAAVPDGSLDLVTNFIGFHHSPPERLEPFMRSLHRTLRPGGRLIVRDHDVESTRMNRMVALAHDVFNMGLGTDWRVNQAEIRLFTSLKQLDDQLAKVGFKRDPRALYQPGDPTKNALVLYTKL
jgi:SAM-dependent methyltransferase